MSNKLHKNPSLAEQRQNEQRVQFAHIFSLAMKYLSSKGGMVIQNLDEVNKNNTMMIRFESVNEDGSLFQPTPSNPIPYGVKAVIEDPMTMATLQQPAKEGLDA